MSESKEMSERDKPFLLAIVASGITIMNIVIVAIGSALHNEVMTTNGLEMLKFTFTLTAMGWTFYLTKREN